MVLRSDGGGKVSAARRPVLGADRVARFLLGVPHLNPDMVLAPTLMPDGMAFLASIDDRVDTIISLAVHADRITEIYLTRNPDKLTLWHASEGTRCTG